MADTRVRLLTGQDIEATYRLELDCFSSPWPKESLYRELDGNSYASYLGVFDGIEQVGYGGMWCILEEAFITNVCISPPHREKGFGRMLMVSLLHLAKEKGMEDLTLEVRVSNGPAIHLYQSLGFTPVGVRKKYYTDNGEDAYTMYLSLIES